MSVSEKKSDDSSEKHQQSSHHDTTNEDIALFMLICMLVGQFMKIFAQKTGVPYTCLITIFGFVLGAFQE